MIEIVGNIWTLARNYEVLAIPTNGQTIDRPGPRFGNAVMGRGVAHQAKERFPGIDKNLGDALRTRGNVVSLIWVDAPYLIVSFPTKDHWRDKSTIGLISRSCLQLNYFLDELTALRDIKLYPSKVAHALLPRPGVGNGGLDWHSQVKPAITGIVSSKVHITTFSQDYDTDPFYSMDKYLKSNA